MSRFSQRLRALAAYFFALAALGSQAAAQVPVMGDTLSTAASRNNNRTPTTAPPRVGPLLDRPVNRAEYRLGPGDVVDVAVFGDVELLNASTVTPEGTIVIPGVGVSRVLGLNLDQAEARVRDLVHRVYRNVDVTVALAQVRSFKVFVVGDVPAAGVQAATSVTRVSEVVPVRRRGGLLYRNVLLRRASGDSTQVDLARFALLGDLTSNPTLREGDALVVRGVEETVQVVGPVGFPGAFEYRPGETLAQLLSLVTGGRGIPRAAADTVRLSRQAPGGQRQIVAMSVADAQGARGAGLRLQPFDAVYVARIANYGAEQTATIQGQVARPGTYPIRPETTTVRDLVAFAGGVTERASLAGATLRRRAIPRVQVRTGEELAPDSSLTPSELEVRRLENEVEADFVVIDLQRVLAAGGDAYDHTLQAGDELVIPLRRNEVAVLGAVARPGLVAYAPDRTVNQYANLAGGYSRRAAWRDAILIRAGTGTRLPAREVRHVEPGDRIIIPFRERRTFIERLQTAQAVSGIISGVVFTVLGLIQVF